MMARPLRRRRRKLSVPRPWAPARRSVILRRGRSSALMTSPPPGPPAGPAADHRDAPTRYRFGAFVLDLARRELHRDGTPVDMPARVFECLEALLLHRDRAVGRDELLQAVFRRTDVADGQLAQVVLRARRCVDDDGNAQHTIRTVPRFGFRWVARTQAVLVDADADGSGDAVAPAAAASASTVAPLQQPARSPPPSPALAGALDDARDVHSTDVPADLPATDRALLARLAAKRRAATLALVACVVAVVALGTAAWWRISQAPPAEPGAAATTAATAGEVRKTAVATVVLPARVTGGGDTAWVRLGLMDFLAERLRLAGLSVPPSENTLALLRGQDRGGGIDALDADDPTLRDALSAGVLVTVDARRAGDGWRVVLAAAGGDGWRNESDGEAPDPLAAARLASDRLLAAMGRDAPAGQAPIDIDERLQRVRAAILANELDVARAILREAPAGALSAPRMRYFRAQVDYRGGDIDAARRELDALLAGDPAEFTDPRFHARLLILRAASLVRGNQVPDAARDFDAALAALAAGGVADEADLEHGLVLSGRAVTRALLGDGNAALADFGAARVRLERAGDRLGVARVEANMGAFELSRGRPAVAQEFLAPALAVFEAAAAMNEQQTTRSTIVEAQLARLDATAALATADRAIALLPRTPDPSMRLAASLDRAAALVALGRLSEARAVLESPANVAKALAPAEAHRATTWVELAWQSGDAARVIALADATLPTLAPAEQARRDWLRLRRAQAARIADAPPARDGGIDTGRQDSPIASLARAVELGDAPEAEALYREALARADDRSNPLETVEVVAAWSDWLLARGRADDAAVLVGRIAAWTARCYDCARLQWRLAEAEGDRAAIATARKAMTTLAGERRLPALAPP